MECLAVSIPDGIDIQDTGEATIRDLSLKTVNNGVTIGAGVKATAASLTSVSGSVYAKDARLESCRTETVSGSITAPQVTGHSKAKSVSGDIRFDLKEITGGDFAGSIDCRTESGSVFYNEQTVGKRYTRAARGTW
jgi:DUF4097 and DUF4098 domain-containing protein YvlB